MPYYFPCQASNREISCQPVKEEVSSLSVFQLEGLSFVLELGIYLAIKIPLQRTKISRSSARFYFEARQNTRKHKECCFHVNALRGKWPMDQQSQKNHDDGGVV